MQRDIVLRIPMCSLQEIAACPDKLSEIKVMKPGTHIEYETVADDAGQPRNRLLCEVAVPGACPRITCFHKTKLAEGTFLPCRLQAAIQSQKNEHGFWMKLPCSMCAEERRLHPITEAFVHGEDAGGN